MTDLAQQPLLTPFRMGELLLPNRIVMAPLTRQRAANSGHVPTLLQAQYYAQRASAGVIISEGTAISPEGYGWVDTPEKAAKDSPCKSELLEQELSHKRSQNGR